jgi:hypothetical protein
VKLAHNKNASLATKVTLVLFYEREVGKYIAAMSPSMMINQSDTGFCSETRTISTNRVEQRNAVAGRKIDRAMTSDGIDQEWR